MKKTVVATVLVLLLTMQQFASIANKKIIPNRQDTEFDAFKGRFLKALWKVYPGWASSIGYHAYDSVLVIPTDDARANEARFCEQYIDSLDFYPVSKLSTANKIDHHLIKNQLESAIWSIKDLKAWQWDPSSYNVSESFAEMLSNKYDKLETRLHNFYRRMDAIPSYYAAAKQNIKHPSIEHTQLAIDQNLGGVSVFENDLEEALKKADISAENKAKVRARAKTAVAAIKDYADWLKHLDNKNPRSFRLGKELYARKFAYDLQSVYTPDEMYRKAVQRKDELHDEMYALTRQLWPKYFGNQTMPRSPLAATRMMIDRLSKRHVAADSFQEAIKRQLPLLEQFIKNKDLLYIDPKKPLVVRKEPAYMAGVAGASITSPGPYDKNGNTYYNVGSLSGWSKDKSESYLREYNHYVLQILDIHEAIPGHYTQLVYANQSPSIIKSILGCSSMIEGWAVYGERMMLEAGYDGDKGVNSTVASPEMWLMYYKWHLRSVCNTILDYSVHTQGMTKDAAMKLLVNEAFQQKTEAENKWKRVSVTQVQLCCYFTGFTEIYELRNTLMKRLDSKFDLKRFHEQFLSYGSAPVKYISELMQADPKNQKHVGQFTMPKHYKK